MKSVFGIKSLRLVSFFVFTTLGYSQLIDYSQQVKNKVVKDVREYVTGLVLDNSTDNTSKILTAIGAAGSDFVGILHIPMGTNFNISTVSAALPVGMCLENYGNGFYWNTSPGGYRERHYGLICGDTQGWDAQRDDIFNYHANTVLTNTGINSPSAGPTNTTEGWGTLWWAGKPYLYPNGIGQYSRMYGGLHAYGVTNPAGYRTWGWELRSYWAWEATAGSKGVWTAGTSYTIGDYVRNSESTGTCSYYKATTSGTSGASIPVHTTGTISDGGVSWAYQAACYADSGVLKIYGRHVNPNVNNSVRLVNGGRLCEGDSDDTCTATVSLNNSGDSINIFDTQRTGAKLTLGMGPLPYIQGINTVGGVPFEVHLNPTGGHIYTAENNSQRLVLGSATKTDSLMDSIVADASFNAGITLMRTATSGGYTKMTNKATVGFAPFWYNKSIGAGNYMALYNSAGAGDDSGTVPLILFHSDVNGSNPVSRPLFGIENATSNLFKINYDGSADAVGGFKANGVAGISVIKAVKGSDGNNCNLVFVGGLLTSTTCP